MLSVQTIFKKCKISEKFHFFNVCIFLKHVLHVTFLKHISRHVSGTFHVLSVTFVKHFMRWTSRFRNIFMFQTSCFGCHVSETFHVLNVTLLKHFMFWTSRFWNISRLECHISKTLFGHLTPFCCDWSQFFENDFVFCKSSEGLINIPSKYASFVVVYDFGSI